MIEDMFRASENLQDQKSPIKWVDLYEIGWTFILCLYQIIQVLHMWVFE